MSAKPCILVSDPMSTGRLYVDEAIHQGYEPIVFIPKLDMSKEDVDSMYEYHFKPMIESLPEGTKVIWEDEDYEKTLEELRNHPIVMAVNGSEMGAIVIDRINHDLGLKGNPVEFSHAHRDKDAMQECMKRAGLRHILGKTVKSVEEARDFLNETGLEEVVVKPLDSAGSLGVHICSCKEEALNIVEHDLNHHPLYATPDKGLLVQERIVGTEYIVNTVSSNGTHAISDVWEYRKICLNTEGNIYDCMILVTDLEPKHIALCEYALAAIDALGIKYGPTHGEYMMDEKGPVLIECGARPMGAGLPESFMDKCVGHHITDITLDAYLNPEAFDEFASKPYRPNCPAIIKFLIARRDRSVCDVPLHEIAKNLPSVHKTGIGFLESLSPIKRTVDLETSPGILYMAYEDEAVLNHDYKIVLDLESNFDTIIYGLDGTENDSLSNVHWNASDALSEAEACLGEGEFIVITTDEGSCDVPQFVELMSIGECDGLSDKTAANTAVLHLSGPFDEMEGFLRMFAEAVSRLNFERIVATEQSFDHFPYGKSGLAHLMRLNGYKLDLPTARSHGVLVASSIKGA